MYGLKRVTHRHNDALARTDWAEVEHLLAEHFRNAGYAVDHVGTGGSRTRFDGGVDLKLRRNDEYIIVQCKHWNAMKVPHNDVHQLIGLMVNEGATGAILVSSGEFTRAAIEAATKQGHVQLVDGGVLRQMLGPLPEPAPAELVFAARTPMPMKQPSSLAARYVVWSAVALLGMVGFMLIVRAMLLRSADTAGASPEFVVDATRDGPPSASSVESAAPADGLPPELIDWQTGTTLQEAPPGTKRAEPSLEEVREAQRKADEAVRVIADDTPEM